MAKTKIEWCDTVWNPVTGCTKVSQGCKHCYAERLANRFWGERKFTDVQVHPERLEDPLKWRKPRRVFVNSMSDLFHKDVPFGFIDQVFGVMARATDHQFLVLTKRPARMRYFCNHYFNPQDLAPYPLLNVWLGVSCEDQAAADERIPLLLETPAAVRFVSCEPLLGPVDLGMSTATCDCCDRWSSRWVRLRGQVTSDLPSLYDVKVAKPGIYRAHSNRHGALSVETGSGLLGIKPGEFECLPKLDWVICGGESGPGARPMHPDWARSLRDQCQAASVPFFFKQWGEWAPVTPQYPEGDNDSNLDELDLMAHTICLGNAGTVFQEDYGLKDYYWCGYQPTPNENPWFLERVGKKAAGRLLDGREWNEFPGGEG